MSGKFSQSKAKKKTPKLLLIALVLSAALLALVLGMTLLTGNRETPAAEDLPETRQTPGTVSVPQEQEAAASAQETQTAEQPIREYVFDSVLRMDSIGSYTGLYMEDGSDDVVSGILCITVTNIGDQALQYAEITLSGPAGEAAFKLSTLKPGESAVVLEANRKPYAKTDVYTAAESNNVAFFQEELSLQEDKLQIQPLDGGFNITNISGQDIAGEITVYFKDSAAGKYYGGITYRGRIQGGMKAGEIRQIISENFSASGTSVVFVTIAE